MTLRAVLLVLLTLTAACRVERRPDLDESDPGPTALVPELRGGSEPSRDSVRQVVAAVNEALALGDVTRVAQLSAPGAVLIDQEEGVRWTRQEAASTLPRPLLGRGDGLGWSVEATSLDFVGEGTALLSARYHASVSGESVPWTAVETWVLVRSDGGWRLRYLHRSRGLGEETATP